MRAAKVYYKKEEAGLLCQHDDGSFSLTYSEPWILNDAKPSISLTLPKTNREYQSVYLFPFFCNMLPEGANKLFLCKHLKIDEDDYFGLLLHSAKYDSIGAVTLEKVNEYEENK